MVGNGKMEEGTAVPSHVAIVALGPSSLKYVQQCNQAGDRRVIYDEVWTVNSYVSVIQSDRLFHMDDFRVQEMRAKAGNKRVGNMLEAIKRYKGPVYTCFPQSDYPTSVSYPLLEVVSKFRSLYFNNTVPYMVAFAGLIGVKKLTLFGCDYTYPGREAAEAGKGCTEHWLGVLHAHGVRVDVCDQSTLMDGLKHVGGAFPLYGYRDMHDIFLEENDKGEQRLTFELKKKLPTAEEIERNYYHGPDAGAPLDIDVKWSAPQ